MDRDRFEDTVSESKEESIAKAISLMLDGASAEPPLSRPNISTVRVLLCFVLWLAVIGASLFLCVHIGSVFQIPACVIHPVAAAVCLLIVGLKAKSSVRCAILLYQKHAPEKIRRACLFTPSCSEYMLLAIEKYGLILGVYKGLRRLGRCHHPNGGEDYP